MNERLLAKYGTSAHCETKTGKCGMKNFLRELSSDDLFLNFLMLACRRKEFWVPLFESSSMKTSLHFFYETRKPVDVQA